VICLFNMNPGAPTEGWNQIMSLPRRLTLDEHGMLNIEPAGDIESLRRKHQRVEALDLPNGEEVVFEYIKGNAMELIAEIDPANAKIIELDVLRSPDEEEVTRILLHPKAGYRMRTGLRKASKSTFNHRTITIDTSRSTTWNDVQARPPEIAQVRIGEEKTVQLRVFVDKSIVEVFIDGRQCSAVRVYPGRDDSLGVSLRATGGDAKLKSLDAWQMEDIYR